MSRHRNKPTVPPEPRRYTAAELPWLANRPTYTTPAGMVVAILTDADRFNYDPVRDIPDDHTGLGCWGIALDEHGNPARWLYCSPRHPPQYVVTARTNPEPPPIPRPASHHERCGCSEREHECLACGMPYWIEIHGCADGSCTYCYHRG